MSKLIWYVGYEVAQEHGAWANVVYPRIASNDALSVLLYGFEELLGRAGSVGSGEQVERRC